MFKRYDLDGTGAAALKPIWDSRWIISEISDTISAASDERVFDAEGCFVTPGLIESHTHFDGTMWWQPDLDPLPGCGVTTVVMGNCGFALAPLHEDPEVQAQVVKIFSFFEDIPEEPFFEKLPWDRRKWSEYQSSNTRNVKVTINYGISVISRFD